jgi:hypothetical protein
MSKRMLFLGAGTVLLVTSLFVQASSAKTAKSQVAQIVQTDASGGDTAASITSLKAYVLAHMGSTVTFTLNGAYTRAQAAAQAASSSQPTTANIYADAQKACSGKTDSITQARCNQAYLQSHQPAATPTPSSVPTPKLADYSYNLRSPLWTPDLAGALLLGAVAALGLGFTLARSDRRHRR